MSLAYDVNAVMDDCKNMNSARRSIVSNLNKITNAYAEVPLESWNGDSRRAFHEAMFGISGKEGLVGNLGMLYNGDVPIGFCAKLNELLYGVAMTVCGTFNEVAKETGGTEISFEDFVIKGEEIVPVTDTLIDYSSITANNFAMDSDALFDLAVKIKGNIGEMKEYVTAFRTSMTNCMIHSINNSQMQQIGSESQWLLVKINEFEEEATRLLSLNEDLAERVKNITFSNIGEMTQITDGAHGAAGLKTNSIVAESLSVDESMFH